jgi:endonuclease III
MLRDNPSSSLFNMGARQQGQRVRRVCEALECCYGKPRHGNPSRPLDDLIYIILSNKTGPANARQVFDRLRGQFSPWDSLLNSDIARVEAVIRPAGLARTKSRQLYRALEAIKADFGRCDLRRLRRWPQADAEHYLKRLPGVSDKVARCVLLYTCDAQVLPVDAHVHRVATRLGWTTRKRPDQCHAELEALVPPHRRYAFHVDCIAHGRLICKPLKPACDACCVNRYCEFFQRRANGR